MQISQLTVAASGKIRVTVMLAADTHVNLKVLSARSGVTMNDIMSSAIQMYLQKDVDPSAASPLN
jgi:hypothetical protein